MQKSNFWNNFWHINYLNLGYVFIVKNYRNKKGKLIPINLKREMNALSRMITEIDQSNILEETENVWRKR